MSDQADRFNEGKPKWSLVHFPSLEPMVRVLEFGAKKYDIDNWKKGMPVNEVIESTLRHLHAILEGELHDEESGLEHIGHVQCNAMFLAYILNPSNGLDRFLKFNYTKKDLNEKI